MLCKKMQRNHRGRLNHFVFIFNKKNLYFTKRFQEPKKFFFNYNKSLKKCRFFEKKFFFNYNKSLKKCRFFQKNYF